MEIGTRSSLVFKFVAQHGKATILRRKCANEMLISAFFMKMLSNNIYGVV